MNTSMYRGKCACCKRTAKGSTINDSILTIKHHPECDFNKGISMKFDCDDLRFEEELTQ